MKKIGLGFMLLGLMWAVIAFNMEVAVTSPEQRFGSDDAAITIPSMSVNNVGLMDRRHNHLIFSGVLLLAGVILLAMGKPGAAIPDQKVCPFCAESINARAVICRYCHKDVSTQGPEQNEQKEPVVEMRPAGPITVKYCPKCTGMNGGEATTCFRCEVALDA